MVHKRGKKITWKQITDEQNKISKLLDELKVTEQEEENLINKSKLHPADAPTHAGFTRPSKMWLGRLVKMRKALESWR